MEQVQPITIREAVDARGWTLQELAIVSGTTYPYVTAMARGLYTLSKEYARRLAGPLGVTPEALLAGQAAVLEANRARLLGIPADEEEEPAAVR